MLALLALEAVVALFAVDVDEVGAGATEAVLDEGALDATLIGEGEHAEQDAGGRHDHRDHEDSEEVVAASCALQALSSLQVLLEALRNLEDQHFDHHLRAQSVDRVADVVVDIPRLLNDTVVVVHQVAKRQRVQEELLGNRELASGRFALTEDHESAKAAVDGDWHED